MTDRCPATYEAVEEVIVGGDTGCPVCGGPPEVHEHES